MLSIDRIVGESTDCNIRIMSSDYHNLAKPCFLFKDGNYYIVDIVIT